MRMRDIFERHGKDEFVSQVKREPLDDVDLSALEKLVQAGYYDAYKVGDRPRVHWIYVRRVNVKRCQRFLELSHACS